MRIQSWRQRELPKLAFEWARRFNFSKATLIKPKASKPKLTFKLAIQIEIAMPGSKPFNLMKWIEDHRDEFKVPVMNRQFYKESDDVIVFVSLGPNTRNDYHVNPTEELFYQLEGDIALRVRPLDGTPVHDVIIREGEMYLLPAMVPHRPQRPDNTTGLIVEFPRPKGTKDKLQWYCPEDKHLVHEAEFRLTHIDKDLHEVMDNFWNGPEAIRTCKESGLVVQRAGEFKIEDAQPLEN
jgi:3-hydroxyanthranilate 3,4-dioxygenase